MNDRLTIGVQRAQIGVRLQAAEQALVTRLAIVRAEAHAERDAAEVTVRSAQDALRALSMVPVIVERDFSLLDRALRAGALDPVGRSVAMGRLENSARRFDVAVRDLRSARARWIRRFASSRPDVEARAIASPRRPF